MEKLVGNPSGTIHLFIGRGVLTSGSVGVHLIDWKKHLIAEKQIAATNIHPGDVNKDGKTDFVASRGHGNGVVWFEAPSWREHPIHATLKEPHSLIVLDMDGDVDLDAATCAYGDKQAWWFENDGKGNFTNHLVATEQEAYDIRAFDMDQDGDLDLVIAGRASNNVARYENPRRQDAICALECVGT